MSLRGVQEVIEERISAFGRYLLSFISELGAMITFISRFFYWFWRPPFRIKHIFEQLYFIGNQSLFIIILSATFSGMVLAYQTYFGFKLINVDSLVGPIVAISLAKELAPVLSGLIVAGRAGAAMAAQIGSMKVTEQIDALEVMGIDSFQYLAVPRILAATIALPILSLVFLFVGSLGGQIVGTKVLLIEETLFFSRLSDFMYLGDMYQGVIKAMAFGFIISVIGTYFGFGVERSASGVGKGTNLAVVWGMILVLVSDYFLTTVLVRIL